MPTLTLEHMAVEKILASDKNVEGIYEDMHAWMRHAVEDGDLNLARAALSAGNARIWERLEHGKVRLEGIRSR